MWSGLLDLHSFFSVYGLNHLFDAAMKDVGGPTRQAIENLLLDRARKVLQSAAYCTTRSAIDLGPPRISAQLAIVTSVLKHKTLFQAEYEWALKTQKRLGAKYSRILASDM